ncbi:MAG: hypothetical protein EAZ08_05925 [Cytophagales bacterium]|nr:MAG: hypothetical protein EAZ08_05925 [Cytophagales bacterium]
MKNIYPKIFNFILLFFLFACQKEDLTINDTYYKIYDTELSGTISCLPTANDVGMLLLEAELTDITRGDNLFRISCPNLIKLDRVGQLEWQFKSTDYIAPMLLQENTDYISLFAYTIITPDGDRLNDYTSQDYIAEIQIDKETGKQIKRIIYTRDEFTLLPQRALLGKDKYFHVNENKVNILDRNLKVQSNNNWNLRGRTIFLNESNQHFILWQYPNPNPTLNRNTNTILAVSQNLTKITTLCVSSVELEYGEIGIITNVFPINEDEYIFVIYSNAGLQTSFYFTPAISMKAELESKVLEDPIFRDAEAWASSKGSNSSAYKDVKTKYGNRFRTPLRTSEIFEKAKAAGEIYRTFDLDFNDRETFIRKAKDRILLIKNSGGYEILIYEYLVREKKYKLLKTLGRNIPYYLQDAKVNENGDLFLVGNTQIAKDLNSLFVIKIPYEDIPK